MKNKIFITLKAVVIATIVFGTASQALAWNLPFRGGPHLPGRTFGSINICCETDPITNIPITGPFGGIVGIIPVGPDPDQRFIAQIKEGSFMTEGFFKAGTQYSWDTDGSVVAEGKMMSEWGFFKKALFPGANAKLIIGATIALGRTPDAQIASVRPPLAINAGQSSVISMRSDVNFCNTQTSIENNTPAIQFWSTKTNTEADVIAKGIQLSGGNPRPGMVLVSTDTAGNAVWGTPVLAANGSISYTYDVAPVVDGQAICN